MSLVASFVLVGGSNICHLAGRRRRRSPSPPASAVLLTLYQRARSRSTAFAPALRQSLADAERYQQRCRTDAKAYYDSQRAKMAERHRREIREANSAISRK